MSSAAIHMPKLSRVADKNSPDFYPTPAWATCALLDVEPFVGRVWEPACGDGAIAREFMRAGFTVEMSDLYDHGFGTPGIDFLKTNRHVDNIVTNPPYNRAEDFIKVGLESVGSKLALLLRLGFLEGVKRYKTLFSVNPPTRVWVFSERLTFYPKNVERRGSGTTAYAWFVWDKNAPKGAPTINWLKPGYKKYALDIS